MDRHQAELELVSVYTELEGIGTRLDQLRPMTLEIDRLRTRAHHLRRRSRELRQLIGVLRNAEASVKA